MPRVASVRQTTRQYKRVADSATLTGSMMQETPPPPLDSEDPGKEFQGWLDWMRGMVRRQTPRIAEATSLYHAGKVQNAAGEQAALLDCIRMIHRIIDGLQPHFAALVAEGFLNVRMETFDEIRQELARHVELLQEWKTESPPVTAEQLDQAKKRYDSAAHIRYEDLAREAGYLPGEEPRELPVPGWTHLVARRHPWRRQLFLKGRNMTVRQLVATVKANHWNDTAAAENLDLPVEAIREAGRYAKRHQELLTAEAEYERLYLGNRGQGSCTEPLPR